MTVEKKQELIKQIILKHSRNNGDYLPDYKFDTVAEEIEKELRS